MLDRYTDNATAGNGKACVHCSLPGLISAAPGKKNCTLQNCAKQVEAMVREKMEPKEYIILCLEDSNDWSNATTRKLVMQVGRVKGSM